VSGRGAALLAAFRRFEQEITTELESLTGGPLARPPAPEDAMPREHCYTTGEVAELTAVCPRTVAHWVDSGLLVAHRLPGSRHRRVARADLVRFLEAHDLRDALAKLVVVDACEGGRP
jgi:excisionase family DNA binding protein